MRNEDKMREEFESRFGYKCYRQTDFGNYQHEETQQRWIGWKACAAIKDTEIAELKTRLSGRTCFVPPEFQKQLDDSQAEIASRDLMIKELREALLEVSAVGMHYEESSRIYWTCPSCEFDETSYPERVKHAPGCALNNALAKSEHHNSRALEKMLLDVRMDTLERVAAWHPLEGNWQDFVRSLIWDCKVKLAELNKE